MTMQLSSLQFKTYEFGGKICRLLRHGLLSGLPKLDWDLPNPGMMCWYDDNSNMIMVSPQKNALALFQLVRLYDLTFKLRD